MTRLYHLAALAMLLCARLSLAAVQAVERAVATVFALIAPGDRPALRSPALALSGVGAHCRYDEPPAHELRHEAGVSRRAAARNV